MNPLSINLKGIIVALLNKMQSNIYKIYKQPKSKMPSSTSLLHDKDNLLSKLAIFHEVPGVKKLLFKLGLKSITGVLEIQYECDIDSTKRLFLLKIERHFRIPPLEDNQPSTTRHFWNLHKVGEWSALYNFNMTRPKHYDFNIPSSST